MLYARIDPHLPADARIRRAGALAELLYIRGILLSKSLNTDGAIDAAQLSLCALDIPGDAQALAATLVAVGLWETTDTGWRVPLAKWGKWQVTAAEQEAMREKKSRAGREGNRVRWGSTSQDGRTCDDDATRRKSPDLRPQTSDYRPQTKTHPPTPHGGTAACVNGELEHANVAAILAAWPKDKNARPQRDRQAVQTAVDLLATRAQDRHDSAWLLERVRVYLASDAARGEFRPALRTWMGEEMYDLAESAWTDQEPAPKRRIVWPDEKP